MIDEKINFLDTTNLKDRYSEYDFRGRDLSNSDYNWESLLSQDNDNLLFDSKTIFPPSVSQKFAERLETAKNRGLGINELHNMGYTGKGVTVAIVDQPLLVSHEEIKDNIIHYEEILSNPNNACATVHGIAVSSILCGKNIGVLPDAKCAYFSVAGSNINTLVDKYIDAIYRIIEYNKTLPEKNKIHTISISFGFGPVSDGKQEEVNKKVLDAVKLASEHDIFVVSTALNRTHNISWCGADRNIDKDLDNPSNYDAAIFLKKEQNIIPKFLVPQDRTTVASPTGNNDYTYYTDGGMSWATPYLAGIYALAKSIDKTLTPDKFFEYVISTGQMKELKGQECAIINPKNLIKTLEFSKGKDKIENKSNNNLNIGTSNDR